MSESPSTEGVTVSIADGVADVGLNRPEKMNGLDRAKEMVFTGGMVEGEEAVQIGMATKVADDPRAAAFEVAAEIAAAIRAAKRVLEGVGDLEAADAFQNEGNEVSQLIGSPNQVESVFGLLREARPQLRRPLLTPLLRPPGSEAAGGAGSGSGVSASGQGLAIEVDQVGVADAGRHRHHVVATGV